jgi:hypothetical protein
VACPALPNTTSTLPLTNQQIFKMSFPAEPPCFSSRAPTYWQQINKQRCERPRSSSSQNQSTTSLRGSINSWANNELVQALIDRCPPVSAIGRDRRRISTCGGTLRESARARLGHRSCMAWRGVRPGAFFFSHTLMRAPQLVSRHTVARAVSPFTLPHVVHPIGRSLLLPDLASDEPHTAPNATLCSNTASFPTHAVNRGS